VACCVVASLSFGVHPLRVEVVDWASAQPYLLAALAALAAMAAHCHSNSSIPMCCPGSAASPPASSLPVPSTAADDKEEYAEGSLVTQDPAPTTVYGGRGRDDGDGSGDDDGKLGCQLRCCASTVSDVARAVVNSSCCPWRMLATLCYVLAVFSKAAAVPVAMLFICVDFHRLYAANSLDKMPLGLAFRAVICAHSAAMAISANLLPGLVATIGSISAGTAAAGGGRGHTLTIAHRLIRAAYALCFYPHTTLVPTGAHRLHCSARASGVQHNPCILLLQGCFCDTPHEWSFSHWQSPVWR
jgi:hypothetical protein